MAGAATPAAPLTLWVELGMGTADVIDVLMVGVMKVVDVAVMGVGMEVL